MTLIGPSITIEHNYLPNENMPRKESDQNAEIKETQGEESNTWVVSEGNAPIWPISVPVSIEDKAKAAIVVAITACGSESPISDPIMLASMWKKGCLWMSLNWITDEWEKNTNDYFYHHTSIRTLEPTSSKREYQLCDDCTK